jgi:hypothetical protein
MVKIKGKPTCEGGTFFIKDEGVSMLGKCACGWWARRRKHQNLPTEKMRERDAVNALRDNWRAAHPHLFVCK